MKGKSPAGALWKIAIVSLITLGAIAVWVYKHAETEESAATLTVPVRVERVSTMNLAKTLTLNSWIEAEGLVTVVSKVSGTLVSFHADVGESVTAGQTLAEVDDEPYRLSLEQARIALDAVRNEADRATKLYESGSASRQVFDQAKSQKEAAETQYDVAALNFANSRVKAPVSGKIVQRSASEGTLVSPSVPIFTIASTGEPLVVARVPEQYARPFLEGRVTGGTITVPSAYNGENPAIIRHIAPYVKSDSRTFEVTCAVGGDTRSLLPGMFVAITFTLEERVGVPTLPLSAISGESTLWVLDRATMTGKPVDAGEPFSDGKRIEIPRDFEALEFIVEGQHFLREGMAVRVIGEADDAPAEETR